MKNSLSTFEIFLIGTVIALGISAAIVVMVRYFRSLRKYNRLLKPKRSPVINFSDPEILMQYEKTYAALVIGLLNQADSVKSLKDYLACVKATQEMQDKYRPIFGWVYIAADVSKICKRLEIHDAEVLQPHLQAIGRFHRKGQNPSVKHTIILES